MISVTTLRHPKVRSAIMEASYQVLQRGFVVSHVRNREGRAYLAVRYNQKTGRFVVMDKCGNDVTSIVARSL